MNRVILQPAGNKDAQQHYVDTVHNPVPLDKIAKYVNPKLLHSLHQLYPSGQVPTWGVTPGANLRNRNYWDKINTGDKTLFAKDGHIFASATVTLKEHCRDLALDLWGTDTEGNTWEYIYFLDEIKNHRIPYAEFNKVVGYKPKYFIRAFNILDLEKSTALCEAFSLSSEIYYPKITESEYLKFVDSIAELDSLDQQSRGIVRKEQGFLRLNLFGTNKTYQCGICGKKFPVPLLVTAHIKKRSRCTLEEKKDFAHIVMPMCKFGCDELYERGYIGVVDQKITQIKPCDTPTVESYIRGIKGRPCTYWSPATQPYFQWHFDEHSRKGNG